MLYQLATGSRTSLDALDRMFEGTQGDVTRAYALSGALVHELLKRHGASIGARSVCVAPVTIGRWALVAAGSVVTKDVPDFALVAGVPARRIRWVGRAGAPLEPDGDELWVCPTTGERYEEQGGELRLAQ